MSEQNKPIAIDMTVVAALHDLNMQAANAGELQSGIDRLADQVSAQAAVNGPVSPSAWQDIRQRLTKHAFVDKAVFEARFDTCRACEHARRMGEGDSVLLCSKCGCFMPLKCRLKGTSCPVGKF